MLLHVIVQSFKGNVSTCLANLTEIDNYNKVLTNLFFDKQVNLLFKCSVNILMDVKSYLLIAKLHLGCSKVSHDRCRV